MRRLLIPALVLLLAALGAGVYFYLQVQEADATIAARQENYDTITAFIEAAPAIDYENATALRMLANPVIVESKPETIGYLHSYTAPEGFLIKSYSEAWDEAMLEQLYHELKRNRHGDEMEYLHTITLRAEADTYAAATHESVDKTLRLPVSLPVLPDGFSLLFTLEYGDIVLYNADEYNTVERMAHNLSHEYGHHYTFFHMFSSDARSSELKQSEYSRLRALPPEVKYARQRYSDYLENHHLYMIEIAAEDYVQLMGSETVRAQVGDYWDVQMLLERGGRSEEENVFPLSYYNAYMQENLLIPLAWEVEGLAEYFYGCIGETPPAATVEMQPIQLEIARKARGFDLVGGYRTLVRYEITWNTPYDDAIYTVLCVNPEEYAVRPVKTVYPGDKAVASVGTAYRDRGSSVSWYFDELDRGRKIFYVSALLPDGTIFLSEPLDHDFG